MGIISFFLAVFTLVAAVMIVIVSVFDELTVTFTRKARSSRSKKNGSSKNGLRPGTGSVPVPDTADAAATETSASHYGTVSANSGRGRSTDYASAFLKKREPAQRRQIYIEAAHFAKVTEILAVVAGDLSVPAFLNNLISEHLERYRDEINELYADKFKKPL